MITDRRIRRIACFFLGHDIEYGNWRYGDPDRCRRCWYRDDEVDLDDTSMPHLLNRLYGWMVEREWAWFEHLDSWLCRRLKQRLPSWWEY